MRETIRVNPGAARVTKQFHSFHTKRWLQGKIFSAIALMLFLAACSTANLNAQVTQSPDAEQSTRTPAALISATPVSTRVGLTPTAHDKIDLSDQDLRGSVIHFWHAWNGGSGEVINQLVEEFNLTNRWGIVVVPVAHSSYDGLNADLDISLAQRKAPDLVTSYLHQALSWKLSDSLVELDRYVDDPVWGMGQEDQADFYPVFWQQDVVHGTRLGIPAQRSGQLLYYNRSWAMELGFNSAPADAEEFARQACASVQALRADGNPTNDNLGGWSIAGGDRPDYSAVLSWIESFGGRIYQPATNPASRRSPYHFNTSQVENTFTYLRGLYDDGCARFSTASYPEAEFAARGSLFSTGSITGLPAQKEKISQSGSQDSWTVLPFPSSGSGSAVSVYGPSFLILPSSPAEQLAAWVFIKWLVSPENQARLVQASSAFPIRRSVLDNLATYQRLHPQWAEAASLLTKARAEPAHPSWETVRWALSDASTQLFRSYFTIDQLPSLLALLDRTADELYAGPDLTEVFATPVPETATPTP